jgi:mevalonate kinase
MKVYAPGKLILSGEHSVVYGKPALAMAINRYASATVTKGLLPHISFHLADLAHRSRLSFSGLHDLKDKIKSKYQRFIRGEYSIRQVLHKPFELAQVALGIFAESSNISLPHGVNIHMQSDIPIGCGMGSSAATILCVMQAVSSYLQIPISRDTLFRLALEAENFQHGQSSGLDLRVAMNGGCLYFADGEAEARALPSMPMYLIHTGKPATTTGQCVESAAAYFQSSSLCDEFSATTNAMDVALRKQSVTDMQECVRQNQRLLTTIGVVPEKVQKFVVETEKLGAAAKICGAGTVSGDQAGALLVVSEDVSEINKLCDSYGYELTLITGETRGVHVV